ncbi:MAG: hypothetical protein QM791_02365 [Ferruginibacter sp.]
MRYFNRLALSFALFYNSNAVAQGVGIGTSTPATSAQLEISSISKGLLIPRMTTTQRTAITSPATGLQVYDITTKTFWYHNGTAWTQMTGAGSGGSNYWVPGYEDAIYSTHTGNTGIGTQYPGYKLHVVGTGYYAGSTKLSFEPGQQGGYYFRGGTLTAASPNLENFSAGIENNNLLIDGAQVQSYVRNINDGAVSDYPRSLTLNPLGGNVGIGTNYTPSLAKLEILTGAESVGLSVGNGTVSLLHFLGGANRSVNSYGGYFGTYTNHPLHFFTNSSWAQLTLLPNGNFGIGITNPGSKLDIKGTVNISHFYWGPQEDVYIRGGKANSKVIINDIEGNVGIGTANTTHKLTVNGAIRAKEIRVNTGWADYVFEKEYQLQSLEDVEKYISEHKHLPGIPPAAILQKEGVDISDIQTKMMAKIEELTLYMIEANKKIEALQQENKLIKAGIK